MRFSRTLAVAATLIASSARASMIHYSGLGLNREVRITYDGREMNVRAGQMMITMDGGPAKAAFCVDLDHSVKTDWQAMMMSPLELGEAAGMRAAYLYNTFAAAITTNDQAAGLQLALWEVMSDISTGINIESGRFRIPSGTPGRAQAQSFLSSLPVTFSSLPTSFVVMSGSSPRSQNLIVPEPATLAMVALGMLALRRRA